MVFKNKTNCINVKNIDYLLYNFRGLISFCTAIKVDTGIYKLILYKNLRFLLFNF